MSSCISDTNFHLPCSSSQSLRQTTLEGPPASISSHKDEERSIPLGSAADPWITACTVTGERTPSFCPCLIAIPDNPSLETHGTGSIKHSAMRIIIILIFSSPMPLIIVRKQRRASQVHQTCRLPGAPRSEVESYSIYRNFEYIFILKEIRMRPDCSSSQEQVIF